MRSVRIIAVVFLLALLTPLALALTPADAGAMDAEVRIGNTVVLASDGAQYRVEDATALLAWYPRENALQDVISIDSVPDSAVEDDGLRFTWSSPDSQENLVLTAQVRTRNAIVPVRDRIGFPLDDVPLDLDEYLARGEFTDSNDAIRRQAHALAAGKSDAYEVVFALADWTTRNVNYSLESLRAPAIQTASQVMATRHGKCDEITALFISLNRELGIPARFVAGYSYTESDLFENAWGGHGWAEVWLPGAGWVPFDVTYGEYGYLDAGHIPMAVSADAQETSISFEAHGRDFELITRPLEITVTPTRLDPHADSGVRIALDAPRSRVGFGSAVLILATVTNERDYYASTRLDLAQTKDTDLLSDTYANVLLHPHETRVIPFLVRIEGDLDAGYRYEFPFVLRGRLGAQSQVTVDVISDGPVYTPADFSDALAAFGPADSIDEDFLIACDRTPARYVGETVTHACSVSGIAADELTVCRASACERVGVRDGTFSLGVTPAKAGTGTVAYTARIGARVTDFYVTTRAVAPTRLRISLDAPATVTPDDLLSLAANITYEGSVPSNVTVAVTAGHSEASEMLERISGKALLRFEIPGDALRPGENELEMEVEYTDEVGSTHSETQSITVELVDVGFWDRVEFWFTDAGAWVGELFG